LFAAGFQLKVNKRVTIICAAFRAPYEVRRPRPRRPFTRVPLSYRIVTLQVATALIVAAGMLLWNMPDAVGALAAGVVCVIPNGYFAWRANLERSASRLLGAGAAKFVGTVVLMAVAFATIKPSPLGFFGTFVALQIVHVVGGARMTAAPGSG